MLAKWIFWILQQINLEGDHTPCGPTLGGATRVSGIAKVMSGNAGQLAQKVGESLTNP